MSKSKKWWMIGRGVMTVFFLVSVTIYTPKSNSRLFAQILMTLYFGVNFIADLYNYNQARKNNT